MKRLLYILAILTLSLNTFGIDDKNSGKENSRTILIKVADVSGEELPGAKITIEENGKEYVTDFNGQIQLQLKGSETITLKIQSLGYNQKTIRSNELSTFQELTLSPL